MRASQQQGTSLSYRSSGSKDIGRTISKRKKCDTGNRVRQTKSLRNRVDVWHDSRVQHKDEVGKQEARPQQEGDVSAGCHMEPENGWGGDGV